MPKGLKRYYGRGDLHFLTFSCYERRDFLATKRARDLFLSEMERVRGEYGFRLVGYVVMPNHVHLLMGEPVKRTVSTVLQMLKQRVARKMLQGERQDPPSKTEGGAPAPERGLREAGAEVAGGEGFEGAEAGGELAGG
jgi:REP element-mobilizing transposase RayT